MTATDVPAFSLRDMTAEICITPNLRPADYRIKGKKKR
jgi:hypothetical protein